MVSSKLKVVKNNLMSWPRYLEMLRGRHPSAPDAPGASRQLGVGVYPREAVEAPEAAARRRQ